MCLKGSTITTLSISSTPWSCSSYPRNSYRSFITRQAPLSDTPCHMLPSSIRSSTHLIHHISIHSIHPLTRPTLVAAGAGVQCLTHGAGQVLRTLVNSGCFDGEDSLTAHSHMLLPRTGLRGHQASPPISQVRVSCDTSVCVSVSISKHMSGLRSLRIGTVS